MGESDNTVNQKKGLKGGVSLRPLPYPYRAAMAICSDLDETPDQRIYFETARFLNTGQETVMGRGVELEVGNTIYFDMPANHFSYWNTNDAGRSMINTCIRSGHIDCLHSFGDKTSSRAQAAKAIDELARNGNRLEVWIDHAVAPTNFGPDIMRGEGDLLGSIVYHADISCAFGIRFVWLGRVTSTIGQEVTRRLKGIWNPSYKLKSFKTILTEAAKGALATCGYVKYGIHKPNQVIREVVLRDGQRVYEFLRSNPHYCGVSCGTTADGIAENPGTEIFKPPGAVRRHLHSIYPSR